MKSKKITFEQTACYCEVTVDRLIKDLNSKNMKNHLQKNKIDETDINFWLKHKNIDFYALSHIFNFYT